MPDYICIGAPYFIGERVAGRTEVQRLKDSGIAEEIGALWVDLQPDFATAPHPVTAVNRALVNTIQAHPERTPIVLAADCTMALGAMKALSADHSPAVIWYDAHGDFNTEETTPSGFLGGMPLAMLTGRGNLSYAQGVDLAPIEDQHVIITDARDLDAEEAQMLRESAITHLPDVSDLDDHPLPDRPLYIHFDTDVVDINEMPGMSYPAPNGPSLADCEQSLRSVASRGEVAGLLFSLWNDSLPTEGKSLAATLRLIRAFVEANG
jgi:arginase